jgi:SagB-type dehydrogenase family enzyme
MSCRIVPRLAVALTLLSASAFGALDAGSQTVPLPKPDLAGKVTLDQAIAQRRSSREYAAGALTLAEISQLMWCAQGITSPEGKRAVPSARAVYPLQVWLLAGDVTGLPAGLYRYQPKEHALALVRDGDPRPALIAATPGQASLQHAAAVIAVVGDSLLAAGKFGAHATRWLGMEAGFVVQDVYLEATALGLGTVMVGGWQDAAVRGALTLPAAWQPLALMPVGRKK